MAKSSLGWRAGRTAEGDPRTSSRRCVELDLHHFCKSRLAELSAPARRRSRRFRPPRQWLYKAAAGTVATNPDGKKRLDAAKASFDEQKEKVLAEVAVFREWGHDPVKGPRADILQLVRDNPLSSWINPILDPNAATSTNHVPAPIALPALLDGPNPTTNRDQATMPQ